MRNTDIPLIVIPGSQIRMYESMIADVKSGKLKPLNGYLLLELPSDHVPSYTEQLIVDLQKYGIIPIIVQPEQNTRLLEQPNDLYQLVKRGAFIQLTAESLTGKAGDKVKVLSEQLIANNLVHFIGTDAAEIPCRIFTLLDAYDVVEDKFGNDVVRYLMANCHHLLKGKRIEVHEPVRVQ